MKNSGTGILLGVLGVVAYLFSLPLVALFLNTLPKCNISDKLLLVFYGPVFFLANHCDFYTKVLMWEFYMLGIPVGD